MNNSTSINVSLREKNIVREEKELETVPLYETVRIGSPAYRHFEVSLSVGVGWRDLTVSDHPISSIDSVTCFSQTLMGSQMRHQA